VAKKKGKNQVEDMLNKLGDIKKTSDTDNTKKSVESNTMDNTINSTKKGVESNTINSVNESVKDNTTNSTTSKKPKITLDKRDNKYSDYRENLYLNENIKKKLDKVSKKTGYSKSELARMAFEYFFEHLQIK